MSERILDLETDARLAALVGDVVTVEAPAPYPVGARVVLCAGVALTAPGKVLETGRRGPRYRLRIRLFAPPAAVRTALVARLASRTDPPPPPEPFPTRR
jgi:hypothetical protein